jgi:4-amino-4-deoxy-L-arabinose transferase-like glycosyltransferase
MKPGGWLNLLLLGCAALIALVGNGQWLPLDAHEIYVARSAEEMIAAGEYLVPQFNGEARIRKPPLCYWLVIGADRCFGADGRVTEVEARLPSAIAGIALLLLTMLIGSCLFGGATAILAGALLASATGFLVYTHSARPDMVHAALCTAGLLGWIVAERWSGEGHRRGGAAMVALGGWLALGLAVLAKGPALPLIIIAGWLIGAATQRRFLETLRATRFLIGFVLMIAVSAWWFILIWDTEPTAHAILQNETIDRYRQRENPWWELIDPYYLYRTGSLILPWAIPYVFALLAPWNRQLRKAPATSKLWWLIITAMFILSFSYGRRWYYMLPLLAPLTLLMSATVVGRINSISTDREKTRWVIVLSLHVMGVAAAVACTAMLRDPREPALTAAAAMASMIGVGGIAMLGLMRRSHAGSHVTTVAAGIVCTLVIAVGEPAGIYWSQSRFERSQFADEVAQRVAPDDVLVGWGDLWPHEIYRLRRTIPVVSDGALASHLSRDGETWVLVDVDHSVPALPEGTSSDITLRSDYDGDRDRLQLWRVRTIDDGEHRSPE